MTGGNITQITLKNNSTLSVSAVLDSDGSITSRPYFTTAPDAKYFTTGFAEITDENHTGYTETIALDLSQATVTLSGATELTYDGNAKTPTVESVTLTAGSESITVSAGYYEVSYSNNADAGTAAVTVSAKSRQTYSANSAKTTFEIGKADTVVTKDPTAKTLTYNTQAQELVSEGSASGGEMRYCLTEDGDYSAAIPTGTEAGNYTVYYKVVGDENHKNSAVYGPVEVTVSALKLETPTGLGIDYAEETITGLTAGVGYLVSVDGETGNGTAYTASETGIIVIDSSWFGKELSVVQKAADSNHSDSDAAKLEIPARPTAPTVTGPDESIEGYNDGSIVITGLEEGASCQISTDGTTWSDAEVHDDGNITGLADGTYYLRQKATASSFVGASASVTIKGGAARVCVLTVTAPEFADVVYGYTQPEAQGVTISAEDGNNVPAEIVSVTVAGVTEDGTSEENVAKDTATEETVTEDSAPEEAEGLIYNGSAQTLVKTGSTSDGTIYYKLDMAGNYKLKSSTVSVPYSITAKTISADMISDIPGQIYAGTAVEPTVTVKDAAIADGGTVLEAGKDYTVAYADNTEVGTAADAYFASVTADGAVLTEDADGNYTLAAADKTYTVAAVDQAGNRTTYQVTVNSGHTWNETVYEWNEDEKVCTAVHVCKYDSTHSETTQATGAATQTKAPTCTQNGETTYTAAFAESWAQTQALTLADVPATHSWAADWTNDGTHHWHECAGTDCNVTENSEKAPVVKHTHTYSSWIVTKKATVLAKGSKQRTCSTCGKVQKKAISRLKKPDILLVKGVRKGSKSIRLTWQNHLKSTWR